MAARDGGLDPAAAASAASADAGPRDAGPTQSPPSAFAPFVDAGASESAMPVAGGEELTARMRHVLDAIAQNNADLARDVVFPREAYLEIRDAKDAGKAWDQKILSPFRKSIQRTNTHTRNIDKAHFVEFELGHTVTRGAHKKHEFKADLWHVKHSRIVFTVEGKTHHLDIAEMTSYRGAWYITRL